MNYALYNDLVKQYEDTTTVTAYQRGKDWVFGHLERLCSEFEFLGVGKPVKHTIAGTTRVSKIEGFIVGDHGIFVDTGFGNVWYYETKKPSTAEIKKFDGHCLVIE
jgi:hypothetical protein